MLVEWDTMRWKEFEEAARDGIAVLLAASCEQHGLHLPMGTDRYLGEGILRRAAEKAKGTVVLLPPLPYGFSAHHMDFPGSITLRQSTLSRIIEEVASGVIAAGFSNVVLAVSHGGNSPAVQMAMNELGMEYPQCRIVMFRYWDFIKKQMEEIRESPPGGIGHAGEMETSLMLALHPELAGREWTDYRPAKGNEWYHPDMFANNKVTEYRRFQQISPYGNVGICQHASMEKGERILNCLEQELAVFFDEYFSKGENYETE